MTSLEYYIHDQRDVLRIEIVGDLTGAGVGCIKNAWRTANSILDKRPLIVGLMAVAEADDDGRVLLRAWHSCGARPIAIRPG